VTIFQSGSGTLKRADSRTAVRARVRTGVVAACVLATLGLSSSAFGWAGKPKDMLRQYDGSGDVVYLVVDESCDSTNYTVEQLKPAIYGLATFAASHEGTLGTSPLRNNANLGLSFKFEHFHADRQSPEQNLRELTQERNAVDLDQHARRIRAARRGPCRTDLFGAMQQVAEELDGTVTRGQPVKIVIMTNGVVVGRGFDFRRPQPSVTTLLARVRRSGFVPRLPQGAFSKVSVVFVGLGRTTNLGPQRNAWLHSFWKQYVSESGGTPYFFRTLDDLAQAARNP
jgi:hypothetical protein